MENDNNELEQLQNTVNSLVQQNRNLQNQLSQVSNLNNTLFWLFEVIKYKDSFNSEFVSKVSNHLESILTPPEETA